MKHLRMKKLLATTLAFSLVMGMGTTAFAKGGRYYNDDERESRWNQGNWDQSNWNQNDQQNNEVNFDFKDMRSKDFEWALRYIADLASRRVFEGYSDGSFKPQETVSRIEAITAAVRVMGLRDKAESSAEMQTHLNFKDADRVPSWAVGYVAVAAENNLFSETDTNVNPNQPADRLWATTLLVKALKLQGEAEAQMNAQLPFNDASDIPAGSVGYVKVAVDKGLVNGFEDNTFRPQQLVTRAQIAALLDRAGNQLPGSNDGLVTGTVTAPVNNNVLTINNNGQSISLTLDPNAFIYRNGARVSASALQVGDVVKTRSYNNSVIFVEVSGSTTTVPTQVNGDMSGTVAAPVSNNSLTITSGGQTVNLALSPNAFIYRNGVQTAATALQTGDVITAHSYNGVVLYAVVSQLAGGAASTQPTVSQLSGTVVTSANNLLTIASGNQTIALALNTNAFIYRSGVQVSASALQAGDVINLLSYNNNVIYVEVTQLSNGTSQSFNVSGNFNGMTLNNQGQIATISINQTGSSGTVVTSVYSVAPSVTINGSMSNLVQNHSINLQGTGQLVNTITIQ
jgi:hypothetical protein